MLGIAYLKAPPTTYVLHYKSGKVKREGAGLSFLYYRPTSTVVMVPAATADVPFVFNEVTRDFQEITIQGQLTYRVVEPKRLARLLDFSVEPSGRYRSEDPSKLEERRVQARAMLAGGWVGRLTLRAALAASDTLVREVGRGLSVAEPVTMLGVEPLVGRTFQAGDTPPRSRGQAVVLDEALARGGFGGEEEALGRTLTLVMADGQNEVRDLLRRRGGAAVGDVVPPAGQHADRCAAAAVPVLDAVAARGATLVGGDAEPCGDRPAAVPAHNRRNYTLTKIIGKRSGHRMLAPSPASILNHKPRFNGIPFRFNQALKRSRILSLRMSFSENRCPLFRIMLTRATIANPGSRQTAGDARRARNGRSGRQ